MNYFDYRNQGMSLGGDIGKARMDFADDEPKQPYGMMAPQQPNGIMAPQQPYGGTQLPGTQPAFGLEGDMSMFEKTELPPPLPNFDKYKDSGFAAGQMYKDVSNAGMNIAQLRSMTQRGQAPYQDFMTKRNYNGLPYGLLGG